MKMIVLKITFSKLFSILWFILNIFSFIDYRLVNENFLNIFKKNSFTDLFALVFRNCIHVILDAISDNSKEQFGKSRRIPHCLVALLLESCGIRNPSGLRSLLIILQIKKRANA